MSYRVFLPYTSILHCQVATHYIIMKNYILIPKMIEKMESEMEGDDGEAMLLGRVSERTTFDSLLIENVALDEDLMF